MLSPDEWKSVKLIFVVLSSASATGAAVMVLGEAVATKPQINNLRDILNNVWLIIHKSRIHKLPDRLIDLLSRFSGITKIITHWAVNTNYGALIWGTITGLIAPLYVLYASNNFYYLAPLALSLFFEFLAKMLKKIGSPSRAVVGMLFISHLLGFWLPAIAYYFLYNSALSLLSFPLTPLMLFCAAMMVPVCTDFLEDAYNEHKALVKNTNPNYIINISYHAIAYGVALSPFATACAAYVGHVAHSADTIPLTTQFILSNIMFDGAAVWLVYTLITRSRRPGSKIKLSQALLVCLAFGVLFSAFSLWFSFLFTENQLGFNETLRILVGKHIDEPFVHLGPVFWMTHTALIPILSIFFIFMLAIIARAVAGAATFLSKRATDPEVNPFRLSSAFFGVMFAFFAGGASIAGQLADIVKPQNSPIPMQLESNAANKANAADPNSAR